MKVTYYNVNHVLAIVTGFKVFYRFRKSSVFERSWKKSDRIPCAVSDGYRELSTENTSDQAIRVVIIAKRNLVHFSFKKAKITMNSYCAKEMCTLFRSICSQTVMKAFKCASFQDQKARHRIDLFSFVSQITSISRTHIRLSYF